MTYGLLLKPQDSMTAIKQLESSNAAPLFKGAWQARNNKDLAMSETSMNILTHWILLGCTERLDHLGISLSTSLWHSVINHREAAWSLHF